MPSNPDRFPPLGRGLPVRPAEGAGLAGAELGGARSVPSARNTFDPWPADAEPLRRSRTPARPSLEDHDGPGDDSVHGHDDYGPADDDDAYYDAYYDDLEDDDDDLVDVGSNATRNALEWAVVLVGAVLVALLLRASLFQAFWIPSESMETTLLVHDRVLVNKLSYKLHDVNRGDVVVFVRPDDEPGIRDLIKRVIGLPGDTVEARDNVVYINGARLEEPYLEPGIVTDNFGPAVVPEGQMFVMGDNREASFDSRRFGTVAENRIVGRAFVLFWPLNRIGWL